MKEHLKEKTYPYRHRGVVKGFAVLMCLMICLLAGCGKKDAQAAKVSVLKSCKSSEGIYGLNVARSRIGSITFLDSKANAPSSAEDVSEQGDGSVLLWMELGASSLYDMYIAADSVIQLPMDCSELFADYSNAMSIRFNGKVDSSKVMDMHSMFANCFEVREIDMTGFDTSAVLNMDNLFSCCYELHSVLIDAFNTAAYPRHEEILDKCNNLDVSTLRCVGPTDVFENYRTVQSTIATGGTTATVTPMVAGGNYHSVYLRADGTVLAVGSSEKSEKGNQGSRLDVENWTDTVAISAASHTVGLRADGTVVACGVNGEGQCNVTNWNHIVDVFAGNYHTVGLRSDGTVVAVGNNEYGQCDVSEWTNIIDIAAGEYTTYGLRSNGTVICAGKDRLGTTWQNVVQISASAYNLAGLCADGSAVCDGPIKEWKRNNIQSWNDIVQVSVSNTHILGLRSDGSVVSFVNTSYDYDQCNVDRWKNVVQVSAGLSHSMGLKADGTILSVGNDAQGQLGLAN